MPEFLKRVLVTGSSGFIGSHLVEEFTSNGVAVVGVDRIISGIHSGNSLVEEHKGDIGDKELMKKLVSVVDRVIHLAAKPSVPDSWLTPDLTFNENVVKTSILVDICNQEGVPLYAASSSSIYGYHGTLNNPYQPISPYGVSKAAIELLINAYKDQKGLAGGIFRFFNVYGPRHRIRVANPPVVARIMDCLKENKTFPIYGDGLQSRDFTYVKDLTKVIYEFVVAYSTLPEPIEVSFQKTISLNHLIETIEQVTGQSLVTERLPERIGDIRTSGADGRMNYYLADLPQATPLDLAISATWSWHNQISD